MRREFALGNCDGGMDGIVTAGGSDGGSDGAAVTAFVDGANDGLGVGRGDGLGVKRGSGDNGTLVGEAVGAVVGTPPVHLGLTETCGFVPHKLLSYEQDENVVQQPEFETQP